MTLDAFSLKISVAEAYLYGNAKAESRAERGNSRSCHVGHRLPARVSHDYFRAAELELEPLWLDFWCSLNSLDELKV